MRASKITGRRRRRRRNRVPPRTLTAPSRRLTWPQVRLIRMIYASGLVTMQSLADLFQVRRQTIEKIIHHETWKDG